MLTPQEIKDLASMVAPRNTVEEAWARDILQRELAEAEARESGAQVSKQGDTHDGK